MLKNLSTTYDCKSGGTPNGKTPSRGKSTCTVEITLYALKGQKLLAQGIALGNYERKPVAL